MRTPYLYRLITDTLISSPSVVQGVRRWIGSRPSSRQEKTRRDTISKPQIQKPVAEAALDRYSTEAVAMALLDPNVSEQEEAEYQG